MKILIINSVCGIRSTGRICTDLADRLVLQGHECKIAYGREAHVPEQYKKYSVRIGSVATTRLNAISARIFGNEGLNAKVTTRNFLRWAEEYNPDILWIHNIHGYYINYEMLFDWIKSRGNMLVKWTLHDCWAFTGHCTYFTLCECKKWKDQCNKCPQIHEYPASLFVDRSRSNFIRKRKAFSGVKNLTLVTPSQWLADITRDSFMKEYPVEVVANTINSSVFKPTVTDFKEKNSIHGKLVLGVAAVWDKRKGLDDFYRLAYLRKDITIVLVGLTKKQIRVLPKGIIGIESTNSPFELAEIYSAADVFFLPSREDNFPTVCLEAEACGTCVITYDVGGCKETIKRDDSIVVNTFCEALKYI